MSAHMLVWWKLVEGFVFLFVFVFFFFKQKTAYEMRISDWSSDVCSSDLAADEIARHRNGEHDDDPGAFAGDDVHRPGKQAVARPGRTIDEIGRASCRESVCQYV